MTLHRRANPILDVNELISAPYSQLIETFTHRRPPRAHIDRLDDPVDRLHAMLLVLERSTPSLIGLLIDRDGCGDALVVVRETSSVAVEIDAVTRVVQSVTSDQTMRTIVSMSVLTTNGFGACEHSAPPHDRETQLRRNAMRSIAEMGIDMLEWFALDDVLRVTEPDDVVQG